VAQSIIKPTEETTVWHRGRGVKKKAENIVGAAIRMTKTSAMTVKSWCLFSGPISRK
jgi:hypothetical protein